MNERMMKWNEKGGTQSRWYGWKRYIRNHHVGSCRFLDKKGKVDEKGGGKKRSFWYTTRNWFTQAKIQVLEIGRCYNWRPLVQNCSTKAPIHTRKRKTFKWRENSSGDMSRGKRNKTNKWTNDIDWWNCTILHSFAFAFPLRQFSRYTCFAICLHGFFAFIFWSHHLYWAVRPYSIEKEGLPSNASFNY